METGNQGDFASQTEMPKEVISELTAEKVPRQPMSFGQQLVGINFNPSNDDKVGRVKKLFAEIIDLVDEELKSRETTKLGVIIYDHTVGEVLNAQMCAVKLLTLKY